MKHSWLVGLLGLLFVGPSVAADKPSQTAYDFSFTSIEGEPLPLAEYRGKVVLVVNTASFCGFTPQYKAMQSVWEQYKGKGFVLLGIPSNDFGEQEPGTASEIKKFCQLNYGIDFPMTEKVNVKGKGAHPFYKWAASELGFIAKPRWNFHKYLIGPDGRLVGWFSTPTKPTSKRVMRAIEAQLDRVNPEVVPGAMPKNMSS